MDLVIPKRKVRASVRLADSTVLEGFLYAALGGSRGTPETVADRLNDPTEKYVPLALEDRHVLLKKASIVSVLVPGAESGTRLEPPGDGHTEFRLHIELSDGTSVVGCTRADMLHEHARALDFLNLRARGFIDLRVGEEALLVNESLVLAVEEVTGSVRDSS